MDDLYANAWSDPPDPPLAGLKPSASSGSSWVSPRLPDLDEEADLAAPSWSTGADIRWSEPSDNTGFSWSQAEPDLAWSTTSKYESIQIGQSPGVQTEQEPPSLQTEERLCTPSPPPSPRSLSPGTPASVTASPERTNIIAVSLQSPEFDPPPTSADLDGGFGTFESAIVPDEEDETALETSDVTADAWGTAWAASEETETDTTAQQVDEWEVAKQQKAKRDRRVPPELLATILGECEEFAREAWPEPESDPSKKSDWRSSTNGGMEAVEGLDSFIQTFLPPLSLQPPVQFGKTTVAKRVATSVRLTKNMAVTKGSPMSHYLAAKGSTAWEAAVKQRKEVAEDDIVPSGWRILEKEPASGAAAETAKEKKPAGRLFSFWGRRESGITHSRTPSNKDAEDNAAVGSAKGAGDPPSHSRRPSQDSVRSSMRSSVDTVTSPVQTAASSVSSLPTTVASTASLSGPAPSAMASQIPSYADAPEPHVDPSEAPQPAPSAVSRFLNRFSRRRSAMGSGSPRNSLALSSEDLEFLSDIVPSASDEHESEHDGGANAKALAAILKPPSLPPILPPPPAPSRSTAASSNSPASAGSNIESPIASLDSFFNALESGASGAAGSSGSPHPSALPMQPTLAAPTLKPSRPSTPSVPPIPASSSQRGARSSSPSPLSVTSAKQSSAPFYLPSPPSSRSQTPVSVSSPAGPSMHQDNKSRSGSFRANAPPPLLPPPRPSSSTYMRQRPAETENQPDTPTSGMPLAQLYPNARMVSSQTTGGADPGRRPTPTPAFSLPPPPSVRSQSVAPLPPPLAPPPMASVQSAPPKRPASLPLTSFDDDDDEFTDFLSSATVPVQSKPIMPARPSMSRKATPTAVPKASNAAGPALALPIPGSSPPARRPATSAAQTFATASDPFGDDDFSDFHFSSATSLHPPQSALSFDSPSFSDFSASTSATLLHAQSATSPVFESPAPDDSFSSEQSFLTPARPSGFDVNAISPVLRTPSPPRPISKMPPPFSLPLSAAAAEQDSQRPRAGSNARLNKAASHLHALNLVERAAQRPGRWPAPPSPLPKIPGPIPGPPSAASSAHVDLLGDDGSPGRPSAPEMSMSLSSPAVVGSCQAAASNGAMSGLGFGNISIRPTPMSHSQSLQGSLFGIPQSVSSAGAMQSIPLAPRPTTLAPSSSQSSSKTGGLSAQDLLFFEGL
ncbi:hypothetical protein IEO21_01331 [Rhodonia placenta]|uniref:Uncharacterized protein n=1 Tax=Rhodonia placenta TaxID=104341 RepID=A0A8H7P9V0_9APHY|nr:hypothetical protein IEO21_01331 [Postia placenta]